MIDRSISKTVLKASLFSLMLLPSLAVLPGLPVLRVDDILLLGWLLIFVMQGRVVLPYLAVRRLYILLAVILLFPISMLNGLINGFDTSFGDFNQFVRFAKYLAMYLLATTVWTTLAEQEAKQLLRFVVTCGIGLLLIAAAQYLDLFDLNKYYISSVAPTQFQTLINDYPTPRPVGMIGNPNELGFLFVMLALLALFCAFCFARKVYILWFFLFSFGVLMTMSRGSVFALGAGLVGFTLVYASRKGFIGKIRVFIGALFVAALLALVAMLPPVYEAYTWRIERVLNMSTDTSFSVRLENWSENIGLIKQHPVLGVGPLRRAEFEHAADNEWLLTWRSYGILGIGWMVVLFVSSTFRRMSASVKAMHIGLMCASFVYMIPTAVFHSLVLFPLLLFLLAFIDVRGERDKVVV